MDTLWFARARDGSDDYSRMARQKCVMSAMLQQVSPQVALRNFEKIAGASSAMVSTDVPRGEVDRFVDLALKAKSQKIATLSLVPPMINTANPDIALVHAEGRRGHREGGGPHAREPVETAEAAPADTESQRVRPTPRRTRRPTDAADGARTRALARRRPPTPPAPPSPSPAARSARCPTGYAANQSEDLGAVC